MSRRVALVLPLVLLLGCRSQAATFTEADAEALRDIAARYVSTSLAGDFDAWAGLLTEDAVFLPPNGPALEGRPAIRQWVTQFAGMASFTSAVTEVGGAGSLAYARGTYALELGPSAAVQMSDTGKWVDVYERQADGSWRLKLNIWNSDQP